ncbi:DUF559 domain-containing protein [Cryobacterium sp. SO2]|uniref:DUF559 domain-containing protein n=1 Tax=Cryobacterium sp. SO2 TaxID=1897060 RepID=UPI00223E1AEB|nr:DUF559 domain-containing protein [Cryobacterium sp. SO2]WEO76539.1 DUF559 domain-containing protein [Cryobacterium sp. SO2]
MPRRVSLPPELMAEPFAVAFGRSLGLTRRRLQGPDLSAPFRGVRAAGPPPITALERSRSYAERMAPTHLISHHTAALLHGLPLPGWLAADPRIHVTVPAGTRAPQMNGVVGHELRHELLHAEFVDGIPVTSPLQTWIDLGTVLPLGALVAVADHLCGGERPNFVPDDLRRALLPLAGRRGVKRLREAASLARARVESPKETQTRLLLVDAGLPEPIVNYVITDAEGAFLARVDLAWLQHRACVEYEGDGHRTDRAQFRTDITRRERLEDHGWRVIRVSDDDLQNGGEEFLRRVRATLQARER